MKKVICCPASCIPDVLDKETFYFVLYSSSNNPKIGHITPSFLSEFQKQGFNPSIEMLDFTTFALSVVAADESVIRSESADGWTRSIELHIYLQNPEIWNKKRKDLEDTLRFLTLQIVFVFFRAELIV